LFSTQSVVKFGQMAISSYKRYGLSVTNSTHVGQMFHGGLATTTSTPTSAAGTVDFRQLGQVAYWNYQQSSY
jgi:hypothetical protein